MAGIAIVYFSMTGTTAALAEAVAAGAGEGAALYRIRGEDIAEGRLRDESALAAADAAGAVIFGSPTYMGGPAAQFKAFADASSERWAEQRWRGKIAGGFTTGICPNGDQGQTLAYFSILAAQHGMLWCNLDTPFGCEPSGFNRLGTQLGVTAQPLEGALPEADLATARYLGTRVAEIARRMAGR